MVLYTLKDLNKSKSKSIDAREVALVVITFLGKFPSEKGRFRYINQCAELVLAALKGAGVSRVRTGNGQDTDLSFKYLSKRVRSVRAAIHKDSRYEDSLKKMLKIGRGSGASLEIDVPSIEEAPKQPETLETMVSRNAAKREEKFYKAKYESIIEEHESLKKMLGIKNMLGESGSDFHIAKGSSGRDNSVAVALASDWHYEEEVIPETVNMMNAFNLPVADRRINNFFSNTVKLLQKEQKDSKIDTMILALLGDFITGNIHEDNVESAQLGVAEALWAVKERIHSGIKFILDNSNVSLVIPCHSGNHGRHTKKQRIANEMNNSLEYIMYKSLEEIWQNNKRVKFIVPNSYHSYIHVFPKTATSEGFTIRFHHGHMVKYGGGVGGLTIPMNKAIAQWNRNRSVNLDCCGHFHQYMYGGNFMVNGSLIGYSPYAISVKGAFEKPSQSFFLINGKHMEPACVSKIFLEDK